MITTFNSCVEILNAHAEHIGNRKAFIFLKDGETEEAPLTYTQLDLHARRIAAELQSVASAGDRVWIMLPTSLDFVKAFFGCLYSGCIAVLCPPSKDSSFLAFLEAETSPTLVLTSQQMLPECRELFAQKDRLKALKILCLEDIPEAKAKQWKVPSFNEKSIIFIQYTSGATGFPKAVMATHEEMMANQRMMMENYRFKSDPVIVSWMPFHESSGLELGPLFSTSMGGTAILLPPEAVLEKPYCWLNAISRYHGQMTGGTPEAYELCIDKIVPSEKEKLNLSSLEIAWISGEGLQPGTLFRFHEYFTSCGFRWESFCPAYILCEALGVVSAERMGTPPVVAYIDNREIPHHKVIHVDSDEIYAKALVGEGQGGSQETIRIVNPDTKKAVEEGQIGEVWVAGPHIAKGYWNHLKETSDTFHAFLDPREGPFLRTGDWGFVENGELFIVGRLQPSKVKRQVSKPVEKSQRTRKEIADWLANRLAMQKEIKPDEIDITKPFAAFGIDSIMAASITNELKEWLHIKEIPSTLFREYPSIDLVSAYLSGAEGSPVFQEQTLQEVPETSQAGPGRVPTLEEFPAYKKFQELYKLYQSAGLTKDRYFLVNDGIARNTTRIDGIEKINFCSYNYLGLSGDSTIAEAVCDAVRSSGTSASASRLTSGEKPVHRELEAAISDFLGTEDCIVYTAGHATNVGTISHLFQDSEGKNLILLDEEDHNSIFLGTQFSGASFILFKHNNLDHLESILKTNRNQFDRALIIVEGVYSMAGDIPSLPRLIELKNKYGAWLMVDEAHSIGTIGETGRGLSEYWHIPAKEVEIWMGTLSKSLGSCGGYIAGSHQLVEYLKFTSPSFVFSAAITPANATAALMAVRQIKQHPELVKRLHDRCALFLQKLKEGGVNTGPSKDSPVIPVIVGDPGKAAQLSLELYNKGIYALPIIYPAVPKEKSLLRFFVCNTHTEEQILQSASIIIDEYHKL